MIYTARQLEDLHKTNGHVRLPVGARLTPNASDWVKRKGVAVAYGEDRATEVASAAPTVHIPVVASTPAPAGAWLWWCDGPCGAAKAALAAQARETNFHPMPVTAEPKYLVPAIKHLA